MVPKMDSYVPQSNNWEDRVAHQRMRLEDLCKNGATYIEDQAVAFYNGQPFDLLEMRTLKP